MWTVSYINSTTSLSCRNQLEREEEEKNEDYKIHEPLWKRLIKEQGAPHCTGEADERRCFTQDTQWQTWKFIHTMLLMLNGHRNSEMLIPIHGKQPAEDPAFRWLTKCKHIWFRKPLSYEALEAQECSAMPLHACPPHILPQAPLLATIRHRIFRRIPDPHIKGNTFSAFGQQITTSIA